jgi:hypothetical protein
MIFILHDFIVIPYRFAFALPAIGWVWWFEQLITSYFVADIFLNFMTGYYDERLQKLVMNPYVIARRYIRGWFAIDCLASFPYDALEVALGNSRGPYAVPAAKYTGGQDEDASASGLGILRIFRAFRYARIFRVIRIFRLRAHLGQIEEAFATYPDVQVLLRSATVALAFFLGSGGTSHVIACLWWGLTMCPSLCTPEEEKVCGETWIKRFDADYCQHDKTHLYLYSLHYIVATLTTVGYGDVVPTQPLEVFVATVLSVLSGLVLAAILGILAGHFADNYARSTRRKRALAQLSLYLQWRNVPPETRYEVRRYISFVQEENRYEDYESALMERLSISLRRRLSHHIFGECFEGAPFLVWMHDFPEAIEELCTLAKVEFQEPGNPIFSAGVLSDVIYFLVDGSVEIFDVAAKSEAEDVEEVAFDFLHEVMSPGGSIMSPASIARVIGIGGMEKSTPSSLFSNFDRGGLSRGLSRLYSRAGTSTEDDAVMRPSGDNNVRMKEVWERIWKKATEAVSDKDYFVELPEIREVEAPAFMGEAVLWNTESEAIRQYTAKCKTRCELVLSRKAHIDAILKKNPLLYERYRAYRWYVRLYTYQNGPPVSCADFIKKVAKSRTNTKLQKQRTQRTETLPLR